MPAKRTEQFTASDSETVVPDDAVNLTKGVARALWIGVAGDITVVTPLGTVQLYPNMVVGFAPIQCTRVNATGTAASGIVALY